MDCQRNLFETRKYVLSTATDPIYTEHIFETLLGVSGESTSIFDESFSSTITIVFDFTRPLGLFHQKKIVFRLPSIIDTIYGNA